MAPILSFTAEEIWQHLRHGAEPETLSDSIHLAEFPNLLDLAPEPDLLDRWDRLTEVREDVLKELEKAREKLGIGNSLQAEVTLEATGELDKLLRGYHSMLPAIFIVSRVPLGPGAEPGEPGEQNSALRIGVTRAPGHKCERCWFYTEDHGRDDNHPTVCGRCARVLRHLETETTS